MPLVRPALTIEGGSSSSGLRRDSAGNQIDDVAVEPPTDRAGSSPCVDAWGSARPFRIRHRAKTRELLDPTTVLGQEPVLRPEDLVASRESAEDEPDHPEELIPKLYSRSAIRKPTRAEIDAHEITHIPYKGWCDVCVTGRGVATPHRHQNAHDAHEQARIGKVAFDWAYFKGP